MQVSCFGIDWDVVAQYEDVESFVDEVLRTDEIDNVAVYLHREMWRSDSWMQHYEAAEAIETMRGADIERVKKIVSTGESLDELGLADLTDGCFFVSASPETTHELAAHFAAFCDSDGYTALPGESREWIAQWSGVLTEFAGKKLGVIGRAG